MHQISCIKNIDSHSIQESANQNCPIFGFNIKCILI